MLGSHVPCRGGGRGRRRSLFPLVLLAALACVGPGSGPPLPERERDPARRPVARVPDWASRPLSWRKLEDIGRWQQSQGLASDPYWVVEAHLQLAEGRLAFAQREPDGAAGRARVARAGFERVLGEPAATQAQRLRASAGLRTTGESRGGSISSPRLWGVRDRASWGARPPRPAHMNVARGGWRWITVHHSAMTDARPLNGSLSDSSRALREIQNAHMNGEGYGDIGYHFLIDTQGRLFQGRDLAWQGAHAGNGNNVDNIGVCLIGNFEQQRPTRAVLAALERVVESLGERFSIPRHNVVPHRHWKKTQCPGRFLLPHLASYR